MVHLPDVNALVSRTHSSVLGLGWPHAIRKLDAGKYVQFNLTKRGARACDDGQRLEDNYWAQLSRFTALSRHNGCESLGNTRGQT